MSVSIILISYVWIQFSLVMNATRFLSADDARRFCPLNAEFELKMKSADNINSLLRCTSQQVGY